MNIKDTWDSIFEYLLIMKYCADSSSSTDLITYKRKIRVDWLENKSDSFTIVIESFISADPRERLKANTTIFETTLNDP